jgi:hypothetical protein
MNSCPRAAERCGAAQMNIGSCFGGNGIELWWSTEEDELLIIVVYLRMTTSAKKARTISHLSI